MELFGVGKELRRFNQLLSEIEAVYHEAAWKLGLSNSAEQILYAICNLGVPCLLSDIVRFSGMSKQTINSAYLSLTQKYLSEFKEKTKELKRRENG